MRRVIAVALLFCAALLAGCASADYKGYVQSDRANKQAFTPFYERHLTQEPEDMRRILGVWWQAWEDRLAEAEGKNDE